MDIGEELCDAIAAALGDRLTGVQCARGNDLDVAVAYPAVRVFVENIERASPNMPLYMGQLRVALFAPVPGPSPATVAAVALEVRRLIPGTVTTPSGITIDHLSYAGQPPTEVSDRAERDTLVIPYLLAVALTAATPAQPPE